MDGVDQACRQQPIGLVLGWLVNGSKALFNRAELTI